MLARYFAENDFGTVTFKLKSWKKADSHRLETVYDVVITGQTRSAGGQIYKLGTINDTLVLTENGVRILSTSKACWALVKKTMSFSQLHLGFGLLGRIGTYRYVSQSQLQSGGLVLAGIANGKDVSVKSLQVSVNGGSSFQKIPIQARGNRALFHHTIKLTPGNDMKLVLKGSNDGDTFVSWPHTGSFTVRCTKKTPDETIALLTRHLFKAWNEKKVEDVLAVFSTNYYGGFSKLSAVLRKEIKASNKVNLVTLAIGSAGPWRRVKTEWRDGNDSARTSCFYFNHALRIVDIRGLLPFGKSSANLVKAANFPIGKRVLRGRVTLDYSQQMCERDKLLMGALFRHGLAIPCTSVKRATTDIVLRHPMIIFATNGAIADGQEKALQKMTTLPNEGWTHALFRKEEKASFYVGCKSKRWVTGKIDQITILEDEGQVTLRYHYFDNPVFEKK